MFIDRARVFVKAGDGGDCMSSFRREKYVPNGGHSGGDGGKGADVVFKADKNINTLVDFRYKRQFKAPAGGNGESSNNFFKALGLDYRFVAKGNDLETLINVF